MNKSFENLDELKKQRIIGACVTEFAQKGYEKASTNEIIQAAGISKGLLFHYFGSKKNLFLYVLDYCLQIIITSFQSYPMHYSDDIFDKLMEIGMVKLQITHTNPEISKIIAQAFINAPEDIRIEIQAKYAQLYAQFMPPVFDGIDYTKFRPGVNPTKALEVIILFLGSLEQKYSKVYEGREQSLLDDIHQIMEEYAEYLEILKYGMYARQDEDPDSPC